jgi:hypothetical protein
MGPREDRCRTGAAQQEAGMQTLALMQLHDCMFVRISCHALQSTSLAAGSSGRHAPAGYVVNRTCSHTSEAADLRTLCLPCHHLVFVC